jgi:uncharacterized membrane protein YukC
LSHKLSRQVKVGLIVVAACLLIYISFYFINEFQVSSEQEELYQKFLEHGSEIDQWLSEAELSNKEAEIRSQQLLDSDVELINKMNEMDSELGITPDEFKNEYPGIGGE